MVDVRPKRNANHGRIAGRRTTVQVSVCTLQLGNGVRHTVIDVLVLRRRAQARDDLLDHVLRYLGAPDGRADLCGAVREEVGVRDERREEPGGEEAQERALELERAAGERGREEEREEEGERREREEAADDGEDVARVKDVVRVDVHCGAGGRGTRELVLLPVELDEGVDSDAHADDAKREGEEERHDAREAEGGAGHGGARR
jgi:hypothetical protein